MKKYHVTLTDEEREQLRKLTSKGKVSVRKLKRVQILLAADAGEIDADIAAVLGIAVTTVERIRKRFVEGGVTFALEEKPRPGGQTKLDGEGEAVLVALACSEPPKGRSAWTMQLLADRIVELVVVDSLSDETVRQRLKKTS
jgi:transposase